MNNNYQYYNKIKFIEYYAKDDITGESDAIFEFNGKQFNASFVHRNSKDKFDKDEILNANIILFLGKYLEKCTESDYIEYNLKQKPNSCYLEKVPIKILEKVSNENDEYYVKCNFFDNPVIFQLEFICEEELNYNDYLFVSCEIDIEVEDRCIRW